MSIATTSLDDLPNGSLQDGNVNLKINDPTASIKAERDAELRVPANQPPDPLAGQPASPPPSPPPSRLACQPTRLRIRHPATSPKTLTVGSI